MSNSYEFIWLVMAEKAVKKISLMISGITILRVNSWQCGLVGDPCVCVVDEKWQANLFWNYFQEAQTDLWTRAEKAPALGEVSCQI